MGIASKLPSLPLLDANPGSDLWWSSSKVDWKELHSSQLLTVAHQLPKWNIPSHDSSEQCQDDQWTTQGNQSKHDRILSHWSIEQTRILWISFVTTALEETCIRSLYVPFNHSRKKKLWTSRLEHQVWLHHLRSLHLHLATVHVHQYKWSSLLPSFEVPHRRMQLWRKSHRWLR
jgi:hypothetical protein